MLVAVVSLSVLILSSRLIFNRVEIESIRVKPSFGVFNITSRCQVLLRLAYCMNVKIKISLYDGKLFGMTGDDSQNFFPTIFFCQFGDLKTF